MGQKSIVNQVEGPEDQVQALRRAINRPCFGKGHTTVLAITGKLAKAGLFFPRGYHAFSLP